jgi:16S rRNA processing protein RimM
MGGDESALMEVGVLGAPYGLRGWLKCRSYTDPPERLLEHPRWQIGTQGEWREYEVASSASGAGRITVKLRGVDSPEDAARLRGASVAVPRSALRPLEAKEYFRADLVGCEVVDLAFMVVSGKVERMIPAVPRYLRRVDLVGRRIYVDWQDPGD